MSDQLGNDSEMKGTCKLCGSEFVRKSFAKHQEFCCKEHRLQFHNEQAKLGKELLAKLEREAREREAKEKEIKNENSQ